MEHSREGGTLVVWKLDRLGRIFFDVMASLAKLERELTVERTRAGLEVAWTLGRVGSRMR